MVMKCERCCMEFKYQSLLERHLARKKKCEKVEEKKGQHKCKFCRKEFVSNYTRNRHEHTCKFKEDHVRNLELELDIEVEYEYSSTNCRFCDKTMRADTIIRHEGTCKAKEEYKLKLQNMLHAHRKKQETGGNTTINNNNTINTINNNTININLRPFGKENLEHITPTFLLKLMDAAKCQFAKEREKHRFARMLYKAIHGNPKYPENHNMLIPSMKGSTALVYTEEGFEHIHRKIAENQVLGTIADVTYEKIALENEDTEEEESRKTCKSKYKTFVNNYIEGDNTYDDESDIKQNAQNRQTIAQASYDSRDIVKRTQMQVNCAKLIERTD